MCSDRRRRRGRRPDGWRMQISSLPYLAGDTKQARAVDGPDGVARDVMAGLYAKQDIPMLAAHPVCFGGIARHVANPNPEVGRVQRHQAARVLDQRLSADRRCAWLNPRADPLLGGVHRRPDRGGRPRDPVGRRGVLRVAPQRDQGLDPRQQRLRGVVHVPPR